MSGVFSNPVVVSGPNLKFELWGRTSDSTSSSVYKQQESFWSFSPKWEEKMIFSRLLYDWDDVIVKIRHWFFFLQALANPKIDFHYHITSIV
jgi:hypothetical protein